MLLPRHFAALLFHSSARERLQFFPRYVREVTLLEFAQCLRYMVLEKFLLIMATESTRLSKNVIAASKFE